MARKLDRKNITALILTFLCAGWLPISFSSTLYISNSTSMTLALVGSCVCYDKTQPPSSVVNLNLPPNTYAAVEVPKPYTGLCPWTTTLSVYTLNMAVYFNIPLSQDSPVNYEIGVSGDQFNVITFPGKPIPTFANAYAAPQQLEEYGPCTKAKP